MNDLPVLRSRSAPQVAAQPAPAHMPGSSELAEMYRFAEGLAKSDMLPPHFKGRPANVLWAMLKADQLGWSPVMAMEQISVINNKPTISAFGMRALCIQAGHRFRVVESTPQACVVDIIRHDDPQHTHREVYTMEMAHASGDDKSKTYQQYPARMLLARCTSNAVSAACPEVLMGAAQYTPEDLGGVAPSDWIVGGGEPGASVDAMQGEPSPALDAGPGEVDNGSSRGANAGPADPGPVESMGEAVTSAKLRGEVKATIDRMDDDQRRMLKAWMKDNGYVLHKLNLDQLAIVASKAAAMVPPDDEPQLSLEESAPPPDEEE